MRKATDTTLRNLAILQAIPAHPRTKNTREIMDELRRMDPEFAVDIRTVQRSLERLSAKFPITCDTHGRANHWYWIDHHALTQIPAMSQPTAFVLRLAREYLQAVMPPTVLRQLDAYFQHANDVLSDSTLGRWANKVAIIRQGPPLERPTIRDDVQEVVYAGLLENRRIEVAYGARSSGGQDGIVLSPLGLVVRAGVVYLVATSWNYQDVRHYVLHRMSRPRLLDEPVTAPPDFRLTDHVREDRRFSYPLSTRKLELKVLFDADVAFHLTESRLAPDHRTTPQGDGRTLIEATVADTADLRWWLLGFGAAVEVVGPGSLRAEFAEQAEKLRRIYA